MSVEVVAECPCQRERVSLELSRVTKMEDGYDIIAHIELGVADV